MKFIEREATRESEEEENGKTEIHERTVRSAFCPEFCVFQSILLSVRRSAAGILDMGAHIRVAGVPWSEELLVLRKPKFHQEFQTDHRRPARCRGPLPRHSPL